MTDQESQSDSPPSSGPAKAVPQTEGSTPPPTDSAADAESLTKDQCNWAMYCHLGAFCGLIGIPFGNVFGPLVIWLIKKDEMPVVDAHGKESLNFQITVSIAIGVLFLAALIFALLSMIPLVGCLFMVLVVVMMLAITALVVVDVVFVIQATIAANRGELMLYPYTWRVIQ